MDHDASRVQIGWVDDVELNFSTIAIEDQNSADTLEIQRAHSFDDQDVTSGMGTHCLVRSAGPAQYGGVKQAKVIGDVVRIALTEEAAAALGLPRELSIPVVADQAVLLQRHLSDLLL